MFIITREIPGVYIDKILIFHCDYKPLAIKEVENFAREDPDHKDGRYHWFLYEPKKVSITTYSLSIDETEPVFEVKL